MSSTLRQPSPPAAYALARDRGPLDQPISGRPAAPRRRGRPPIASADEVLDHIRTVATNNALFRVHIDQPALYARARRLWGSWAGALKAAGLDYDGAMAEARRRALATRRRQAGERARGAV
jgi:hypothetical protein